MTATTRPRRRPFAEAVNLYPVGTSVRFNNADDDRRVEVGTPGRVVWAAVDNVGRNVELTDGRVVNVPTDELDPAAPVERLVVDSHPAIGTARPYAYVYAIGEDGRERDVAYLSGRDGDRYVDDRDLIERGFARVTPWETTTMRSTMPNELTADVVRIPYRAEE